MAIYLANQWQDIVLWRHNWHHNSSSSFDMTSQLRLGTWVYVPFQGLISFFFIRFSYFPSVSQVMAIYLPNQWQDTVLWRHNWRHNYQLNIDARWNAMESNEARAARLTRDVRARTYGHARTGMHVRARTSIYNSSILCVYVCVSATAVSRQPPVRSNWNLPGILLGTWICAFSRFDINRTRASQVMAVYLPTNDRTRCCVGVADGGTEPQPRSPLRVTTYGLPESDDFVYSNNFSISYAHL